MQPARTASCWPTAAPAPAHIHLAEAGSDLQFSALGAAALGWSSGGQVNPQLLRLPDGRLLLAYQNLAAAHAGAYLAVSDDDGHSWDLARTRLSPGPAALPRLAYRPADGRLLALYQTGSNPVTIWARSSDDPLAWTTPPQALASGVNDHDPWPVLMADGRFVALWSRAIGDAFQLHAAHSADGRGWSTPTRRPRPGLRNKAHACRSSAGTAGWKNYRAPPSARHNDYDLWPTRVLAVEALFADGFDPTGGERPPAGARPATVRPWRSGYGGAFSCRCAAAWRRQTGTPRADPSAIGTPAPGRGWKSPPAPAPARPAQLYQKGWRPSGADRPYEVINGAWTYPGPLRLYAWRRGATMPCWSPAACTVTKPAAWKAHCS